jgi:hypothetical protein
MNELAAGRDRATRASEEEKGFGHSSSSHDLCQCPRQMLTLIH